MAFLVEQAGGSALLGPGQTIMDVKPSELHQRVPVYIGSKEDVEEVTKYL